MAERLNKDSFQEKVLNASGLAIADFYSDSCIPCKKLSPILAALVSFTKILFLADLMLANLGTSNYKFYS